MSGLPTPLQAIHAALRAIDSSLENVGLAAEAVHTSLSPIPPITSDYNEAAPESFIAQGIGAIRAQIRRGLPVTAPPTQAIVWPMSSNSSLTISDRHRELGCPT
jgi:hypothetical protein